MTLLHSLQGTEPSTSAEVGGEALSLIRMSQAGMPVPPGIVLSTSFFTPWFDKIQTSNIWGVLKTGERDMWPLWESTD